MTIIELLEYVRTAGGLAAPIFAVLFWLERDEKKDAQKELLDVTRSSIEAMVEMKSLVSQLMILFNSRTQQTEYHRQRRIASDE